MLEINMGNCLKVLGLKKLKRPVTLLLVGLDNAGKTTAAKGIVGDSLENVAPTVGFSPEALEYRGCTITIYDLGGGPRIRAVWPKYFSEIHGVIYVIDSSDKTRVEECHLVLEELLSHKKVSGKPVLVLANKQDVDGALDEIDIVETLKIEQIVNSYKCPARVETCSAISIHKKKPDKPIADGFRWLIDTIVVHYKKIHKRVEDDMAEDKERLQEEMERRKERIRLIREERERKEREEEEEAELAKLQKRQDSDDEAVVISKPTSELLASRGDQLTSLLNKIENEDETVLSEVIPIETEEKTEESPLSLSETKELQELGFNSARSLNSSTSSSSSSDFQPENGIDTTSPTAQKNSLSTHLIEVHPSPQDNEIPEIIAEGCFKEKMTAILLEDSPLRSSECIPIDSDDELFSSVKDEDGDADEETSPHSVLENGSVIAGIKEQIELEASLTRKPRRKTFLKRLHRTAPMTASTAVTNDFIPTERITAGTHLGRIP